jgi:hypothetical protein
MSGTKIQSSHVGHQDPDERLVFAHSIVDSETFRRSNRLKVLLLHLCDRAFTGHSEELTEQQIGMAVFGKAADYDSANENVVRVAARQLRLKLQEYFNTEGHGHSKVLVIPKGSYVPVIQPRQISPAPVSPAPELAEAGREDHPKLVIPRSRGLVWLASCACIIAVLAIGAAFWNWQRVKELKLTPEPIAPSQNLIRATVLIPGQRTLIVVGDPNLRAFGERTGTHTGLEEYLSGRIPGLVGPAVPREEKSIWERILAKPQADTSCLQAVVRVLQANFDRAQLFLVQPASEVRGPEFRASNVVLIGDPLANPWMDLVMPELNFQMFYDGVKKVSAIRNREPKPGELAQYSSAESSKRGMGFAELALRPNLNRNGSILLMAGTNAEAVATAADFACNRDSVLRVASVLGVENLQQVLAFELVLRVDSIEGISHETQVVAFRVATRSKI